MNILEHLEDIFCQPRLDDARSVLLSFPGGISLTVKDSFEGIVSIGSIGSGKTSADRTTKLSLLKHGYGVLVCCVKASEADEWVNVAKEAGRSHDVVHFRPGGDYRFDPFEKETNPAEAVLLVQEMMEIINGCEQKNSNDIFWQKEGAKLLLHAFTITYHAIARFDWIDSLRIIQDHATDLEQVNSKAWRERSYNYKAVCKALEMSPQNTDVMRSYDFWLRVFPAYDPKTRANVLAVTANLLEQFQSEPLRSAFSGNSNCSPLDILSRQKIIIIDFPVLQNRMMGLVANSIWLYCTCRVATQKNRNRPAAIHIDEAQFLLTPEMMRMQSVIRSHSVSTILLFQNLGVLQERMTTAAVDGLLGSINTVIFTRQSDAKTRQWAADRIGKKKTIRHTRNSGTSRGHGSGSSYSISKEAVWDYKFHPDEFSNLATGGKAYGYKVGSIVLTGAKAFKAKWHQLHPGSWGSVKPKY
jgi:type IV secretory pathway TraG/TraD family ATPase VirD4